MRGPKKSETLEIRLPHALKAAFMARCAANGTSASEAVRGFIEARLAPPVAAPAVPAPRSRRRWIAAAAAAATLGAVAAPSLARPGLSAQFARLDSDHDGRVSLAEFDRAAALQLSVGPGLEPISAPAPAATQTVIVRRAFERLDTDRDGFLSLDEFRRAGRR